MIGKRERSEAPQRSFFVSGGTVPVESPSYVERAADRQLFEALRDGRFCYVLNSRQMGKSSLCVRTKARLELEGIRTAFVDLTKIGGRNVTHEQWYAGLMMEIGRSLGLRNELLGFWKEQAHLGPMQRLFESLRDVVLARLEGSVVVFIDEIDATRSLPFDTDEFFAGIRECYNRRVHDPAYNRLTFCLLGVAVPSDLIHDARTTPFNIGERVYLRDFTIEEALTLSRGLDGRERLIRRVYHWTHGHPFLTQSLCTAVVRDESIRTEGEVDALVARELFEPKSRETNINLADVGNRVLNMHGDKDDVDRYRADVLSAYEKSLSGKVALLDDESNRVNAALKLSGLMRTEGKALRVRNPIYERVFNRAWIRENMPGQELRRQRAAFVRGVLRTAAISVAVLSVIGALAVAAVRSAQEARVAKARAEASLEEARRLLYAADMAAAYDSVTKNDLGSAEAYLLQQAPKPGETDRRGFEWRFLWALSHPNVPNFRGHKEFSDSLIFSRTGKYLASVAWDGEARLWSVPDGKCVLVAPAHTPPASGFVTPDERHFVTMDIRGTVRVFEISSGRLVSEDLLHSVGGITFRLGGDEILFADTDGWVRYGSALDAKNCKRVVRFKGGRLLVSPDGRHLGLGHPDRLETYDLQERRVVATAPITAREHRRVVPDSKWLLHLGSDKVLRRWSWPDLKLHPQRIHVGSSAAQTSAFSPDGRFLALAQGDTLAPMRIIDLKSGEVRHALYGMSFEMSYSPDGKWLAVGNADGTIRLWPLPLRHVPEPKPTQSANDGNLDHLNGSIFAYYDSAGNLAVQDLKTGKARSLFSGLIDAQDPQLSRGGKFVAVPDVNRVVTVAVETGKTTIFKVTAFPSVAAISSDGMWTAVGTRDRVFRLFGGAPRPVLERQEKSRAWEAQFAPDDGTLAVGFEDGVVRLYDVPQMNLLREFKGHARPIQALGFSPDGKQLASGSNDRTVRLWDVATGSCLWTGRGHTDWVEAVAFHPDGNRVATAAFDRSIRVWDRATGLCLLRAIEHDQGLAELSFSKDGTAMYSTDSTGMVKVWPIPKMESLRPSIRQAQIRIGGTNEPIR